MKSVFQFSTAIVGMAIALASVTSATPVKRSGITCTKTYGGGDLRITNLHGGKGSQAGDPNDPITETTDGNNYLTTNPDVVDSSPSRFQFDTCQTDGWNVDGQLFGQLKITDVSNTKCVTAIPSDDNWSLLQIQDCESYNGGNLYNQWFKASPGYDSDLGAYIELELTGNPNDYQYTNDKPIAVSQNVSQGNDLVFVHPLDTPVPVNLALFGYSEA
ncbi:uncharacterized protein FA14DRAFT_181400 [Meira miltonrushii]|uniref:Ricin B lectin domain-containing protein n=1 Tax=Meira miltonrushii TaxID=1280837 RepID=A0A316V8B3_9BASI|nr:uncharacterized protein FA14DRAFT_181400 [Meira miltonrushii]PWN32721.1 hypothetical protein FA14DRAFT_181400 [Meira miltonrushii]